MTTTPSTPVVTLSASYSKAADTRVVYVSSSGGADKNSGLTPALAKKTLAAGIGTLRSGAPDWLLLKKGDTWHEGLGAWKKSGRSAGERMLVGSYGTGARPVLETGSASALDCQPGGGTPSSVHSLVFLGLHLRPTPGVLSSRPNGIKWVVAGHDITLDDCLIEDYGNNVVIQSYTGPLQRFTLRNCVILDAHSGDVTSHSQGIYADGIDGLLIEDSVFDHNGWHRTAPGGAATMYNHNQYLQMNCKNVVVRRNILTRASSHAIQLRAGGVVEDNFCFRNPIAIMLGYQHNTEHPDGVQGVVANNVVLASTDIDAGLPRGWGISFGEGNLKAGDVKGNIVAHVASQGPNRRSIETTPGAHYVDNVIFDWTPGSNKNGWGELTPTRAAPFKDASRTVEGFDKAAGGPGTLDNFYAKIRGQSRDSFDTRYAVAAINAFFRGGFARP